MLTTTSTAPAKDRPTFTLQLRPEPGVDPVLALRAVLKNALRYHGMRCVSAKETALELERKGQLKLTVEAEATGTTRYCATGLTESPAPKPKKLNR
jgi:hypothetical protein